MLEKSEEQTAFHHSLLVLKRLSGKIVMNGWPGDGLTRQKKTDDRIIEYEQT